MEGATKQQYTIDRVFSSDALAVAALTALGTSATYFYEAGHLIFYGVPLWLIEINATRIVIACTIVGGALVALLGLIDFFLDLLEGKHPIKRALVRPAVQLSFLAIPFLMIPIKISWWLAIIVSLPILCAPFVSPLLKRRAGTTFMSRLEQRLEDDQKSRKQKTGLKRLTGNIFVVLLLCIALAVKGMKTAQEQESHLVLVSDPTMVLVNIFGDTAVLVGYDAATKRLTRSIRLERVAGALDLRKVETGKLQQAKW